MAYIDNFTAKSNNISYDASGKQRVAQTTTLLDGKILNQENPFVWDNVGTGTGTWASNKYNMSVGSNQYRIRQTKRFYPYFAGKSQAMVLTFDNFQLEIGIIKRVGYFSSSTTAPYDTVFDGFFLESNGTTSEFRIKSYRAGTLTVNELITVSYDWSKFTVISFDFLWLGGAILRFFLKTANGFELIDTVNYSGTAIDTFILSSNQPIRYEIRSSPSNTGSFRYICSELATEGSINESGYSDSIYNQTALATNTIGTIYVLKGIRKKTTHRDSPVQITDFSVNITASTDAGIAFLAINPILSAPVTFVDVANSPIQDGTATNQTVTALGRSFKYPVSQNNGENLLQSNFLSWLGDSINGTRDEYYLCYMPTTATQTVNGIINFKEY